MTRTALLLTLFVGCATTHTPTQSVRLPARDSAPKAITLGELLGIESKPASTCPASGLLKLGEIDGDSAERLTGELTACVGRPVVIEIDSPGGGIFAAQDIQKAIERHDKPVFCVVDGMAASAAFVTLQACTSRYATSRSLLMAHEGSVSTKGQSQELTNGAELLRVLNWGMAAFCARRMGIAVEAFQAHVSGGQEWWLSQADAMREHAIDGPALNVAEVVRLAAL
jgi:ATP-dependent protease ClpP protease subunit